MSSSDIAANAFNSALWPAVMYNGFNVKRLRGNSMQDNTHILAGQTQHCPDEASATERLFRCNVILQPAVPHPTNPYNEALGNDVCHKSRT